MTPSSPFDDIVRQLAKIQQHASMGRSTNSSTTTALPSEVDIKDLIHAVRRLFFPGYFDQPMAANKAVEEVARSLEHLLLKLVTHEQASSICASFVAALPGIALQLVDDLEGAYQGDPAATSREEIIYSYPGFRAVMSHRFAHALLAMKVPLLPRMMAEISHSQTGIDIHPGAVIGRRCFIDHGTGVVIGETCVIGDNVKIYQGVTLGALSFARDASGELVRHAKRHPTIGDNVVIYANSTILGGNTHIGHDSVIGSGVWLNQSVAPFTIVTMEKPLLRYRGQQGDAASDFQI